MKHRSQQLPKTIQKPSQIHPKTFQNRDLEGGPLEIAFRSQFFPLLARAGPPLGGVLGCSWAVLWRLGRVLGASRDVLGASWAVLGASCSILCLSWGVLRILFGKPSENHRFYIRKSYPEPSKIKPPLQREHDLRDFEIFENNLPFATILVPTCLHFGSIFRVLGRLGASWGHLGASWRRLGPSWGRLGAPLGPLGALLGPLGHLVGPS